LKVKEVNNFGAFLDWGISKDLFVAYSEQRNPMAIGERHLVYIFVDELSGRLAATERWHKHIQMPDDIEEGEEVQLLIAEKTDLGWRAIINNTCEGLIYQDEVFRELKLGDLVRGYVRLIRDDGKVDLRLQPEGYSNVENTTTAVMHSLEQNNGVLPIGDKSPAEDIYRILKISKKTFKKTIGALYKQRLVEISDNEVKLVKK
jgi:predicted RNA-binding protein (virulence factor B family)